MSQQHSHTWWILTSWSSRRRLPSFQIPFPCVDNCLRNVCDLCSVLVSKKIGIKKAFVIPPLAPPEELKVTNWKPNLSCHFQEAKKNKWITKTHRQTGFCKGYTFIGAVKHAITEQEVIQRWAQDGNLTAQSASSTLRPCQHAYVSLFYSGF